MFLVVPIALLLRRLNLTCCLLDSVFGLAASFVSELASIWVPLPMLVLAVPSALAGFLALRQVENKYNRLEGEQDKHRRTSERLFLKTTCHLSPLLLSAEGSSVTRK